MSTDQTSTEIADPGDGDHIDAPTRAQPEQPGRRRGLRRIVGRTLGKAWNDDIFSHSAQAAFWQTLSLPPLFLALLGSLGYLTGVFGPATVENVEQGIVGFSSRIFTPEVVEEIISPTATTILTRGRADVVSIGFLLALFAGSSATASLVDSITEAHGQKLERHPVWQRIVSLMIYVVGLLAAVLTLPLVALGPDLLPQVLPVQWRPTAVEVIGAFYYPVTGLVLALVLTALYKVALRRSLPWRRLLPGALLAMVVFFASASGLRYYILLVTSTGYTYGALATPIAFLLVAFLLGFSIIIGAHLNSAVQEVWPVRPTRRERRLRRLLSMRRIAGRTGRRGSAESTAPPREVTPDLPAGRPSTHAAPGGVVPRAESDVTAPVNGSGPTRRSTRKETS